MIVLDTLKNTTKNSQALSMKNNSSKDIGLKKLNIKSKDMQRVSCLEMDSLIVYWSLKELKGCTRWELGINSMMLIMMRLIR